MSHSWAFELGQKLDFADDGGYAGRVVGRAQYVGKDDAYLLRKNDVEGLNKKWRSVHDLQAQPIPPQCDVCGDHGRYKHRLPYNHESVTSYCLCPAGAVARAADGVPVTSETAVLDSQHFEAFRPTLEYARSKRSVSHAGARPLVP
jgi:hypothetical protein